MSNQIKRELFRLLIIFLVLVLSISAYITTAWYSKNEIVQGDNAHINSDTPPLSLFITNDNNKDWKISVSKDFSDINNGLFPISTADGVNWYYVSGWSRGYYDSTTGWKIDSSILSNKLVATKYIKASISEAGDIGTYTNIAENNQEKVAYLKDSYSLYTNGDNLDIYLDPDNPIILSGNCEYYLDKAIRIGIKVSDKFLIYAPFKEDDSAVGNSLGSIQGNNYYAVISDTQITGISVIDQFNAGTGYVAQINNGILSSGNAEALGSCSYENPLSIDVFIWLEGTDSQALQGISSNDKGNLTITINYVGIE